MATSDLAYMPIHQLIDGYRKRTISPVEATAAALSQITRHNAAINPYAMVDEERAQPAAKAAEARWHSGDGKSAGRGQRGAEGEDRGCRRVIKRNRQKELNKKKHKQQ